MTKKEVIEMCNKQIALHKKIGLKAPPQIEIVMQCKRGKTNRRRLCPGGPWGEIVYTGSHFITVLFDAAEVKKIVEEKEEG